MISDRVFQTGVVYRAATSKPMVADNWEQGVRKSMSPSVYMGREMALPDTMPTSGRLKADANDVPCIRTPKSLLSLQIGIRATTSALPDSIDVHVNTPTCKNVKY